METTETTVTPAPALPISSIDAIQAAISRPIKIQFDVSGQRCEIEARLLKPFEDEIIAVMACEIIPPMIRGKTEADDRMDAYNKEFLTKKEHGQREIRALGLFWAIPALQDKMKTEHPEAVTGMHRPEHRKVICSMVDNLFDDEVLNHLWSQIRTSRITVPPHVNFSYPAG